MTDENKPDPPVLLKHWVTSEGKLRIQFDRSIEWIDFDQFSARNIAGLLSGFAQLNFAVNTAPAPPQQGHTAPVLTLFAGGKKDKADDDQGDAEDVLHRGKTCDLCKGSGRYDGVTCGKCAGQGAAPTDE